jgi:serine/threonine-protein kinase
MLRPDGYVKVLDFGLAKLGSRGDGSRCRLLIEDGVNTESGVVMGTPRCMSPEQARGEKADAHTDIFSLGVVFYEMIAGRAFHRRNQERRYRLDFEGRPPPLASVAPATPPELGRIICKRCRETVARCQTYRI